jgi:rhodanese-related sulfurtransferase
LFEKRLPKFGGHYKPHSGCRSESLENELLLLGCHVLQFITGIRQNQTGMTEALADIEIEPRQVQQILKRGDELLLVDVREPWEHETARIEGSILIPLRAIPDNISRLADPLPVVVYCHHGIRSFDAAAWLRSQGIDGVRSMSGGIERWSAEVDPKVPRY